jgi:hypothetical protein
MDYGKPDASDEEIVATLTAILGDPRSANLWTSADYQEDSESGDMTQGYSVGFDDSAMLTLVIVPDYPINPTLLAVIGAAQWYDLEFTYAETD